MRVKVIPSVKSGLMCVQVGVIGGSGFYKLEELEDTKQITVSNSFICKLIPGSGFFVVLLLTNEPGVVKSMCGFFFAHGYTER